MGLGMHLVLLRPRRNRCAPFLYLIYIRPWTRNVKNRGPLRNNTDSLEGSAFPMELKTQALDRLLEALSPALSAELDRVVREKTESLEDDFKQRLQTAVREAETSVRENSVEELNRAVAEAAETMRRQVTQELERKFAERLAETTNQL